MRLVFVTGGGGYPEPGQFFVAEYGEQFFAIDGKCRYYAEDYPTHAVVTGTLSTDQVKRLSADVAWDRFASWGSHSQSVCADAGATILGTTGLSLYCGNVPQVGCGCDETAPPALQAAQDNALRWVGLLVQSGTPLRGPTRAIAMEPPFGELEHPYVPWPLARSMASIPGLIVTQHDAETGTQARFVDDADTMRLRAFRDTHQPASRTHSYHFDVRDEGHDYALFLRDEIPDADAHAIQAVTTSWSSED